jgi:hypothetical protein
MSTVSRNLVIESTDSDSPRTLALVANQQFPNTEQVCTGVNEIGFPVPAGTVYGDTQELADAAAEALLVCELSFIYGENINSWSGYPGYTELSTSSEDISSWSGYPI